MAELMDKQGILDELRRRSGGAQQEQTPLADKQQILDYLRQKTPGQGTGTFAPVQQTPSAKDFAADFLKKESAGYFQAGMLDDKDKNIAEKVAGTYVGTAADVSQNVYSSGLGMGEKFLDFLASIAPYLAAGSQWNETAISAPVAHRQAQQQMLESNKQLASDFVEKDLYNEDDIARKIVTDPLKKHTGIDADTDSVLGEKSDAVVQSLAQMALTAAMGGSVPWWVVTGTTSLGGEAENAVRQGASLDQAVASGLVSAGAEVLSEKLFGGSGLGEKGFLNLDVLTKKISNKLVKTLLDYGVDMAAEGAEEVVSSVASNLGSALYREENLADILASEEALQEYLDSFISGAALGGLMNVGKVGSSVKNKTDYRNGLTAQEQKVFDQQYDAAIKDAEKGGKLTREQRAAIYDATLESVRAQQPQSATQSGETAQAEKVPTQAETPTQAAQTAQTPSQPMTPQQAMQETIAEIIGIPSVSQAVESYRESGTVTNKQAEAIASNANAVQELLEMAGIAPPSTKSQTRAAVKQAVAKLAQESVDNTPTGDYDRITNQGGNAYAEQNAGAQYSAGAIGANNDFAGVQAESRGTSFEDIRQQDRYAERDEDLRTRLSGALEGELERRGYRHGNADGLHLSSGKGQTFEVLSVDASTFHDIFEVARKYTKNGELVDLHDVKTTKDGIGYEDCENYISADGMSGFSITPDGDLISVFNAHGLKKKGFLRAIAPVVKAKVKTLDCYMSQAQPLHEIYEKVFGMKIASVMEHNMLYDHDSIAANHGNPKVAFMVNSDADVTPEFFGKEDYDAAKAHQVSSVQGETTKSTLPEHAVGANKSDFEHRQARSAVYENTYQNATDKDVLDIGIKAEVNDPNIGNYHVITEKESLANAELRTRNAEETMFEYEDLVSKSGWSGEDNDTAFRVLDILNKAGKTEEFKKLARKQREEATRGGQLTQSFAKYSRMNGAAAAAEVVADLDKLNESDVPNRFYRDGGFDKWKGDVITSSMNIAKQIDSVEDGDVEGMKDIIRSMAKWRKTTAWFGLSSDLSKAAEAAMKDIDFETAKAIANAQLSTLPTDFKKRPVGQVVKTIRIHNMLSALTTINRNLVGNTAVGFIDATSDSTSGRFIDALVSKVTGKRTVGNDIKYGKTYMDAAWKATKMASLCAELDIPMDSESRFTTGITRTYSPQGNPIMRFMSAYEKYMKYALEVTDQFYQGGANAAVDASLQEISGNGTLTQEEAEAIAKLAGQRRTLKDERAATRMAKKVRQGLNEFGTESMGLGDLTMPFASIGSTSAHVAVDYTAGAVTGLAQVFKLMHDVKSGRYVNGVKTIYKNGKPVRTVTLAEAQRAAVTNAGRGITGLGLVAAFAGMAAAGILKVHDDKDKDKRGLEQAQNLSGAQLNIDAALRGLQGKSTDWQADDLVISVDFLEPFNAQMYLGYLLSQDESVLDAVKSYTPNALRSVMDSIADMPAMQGMQEALDILSGLQDVSDEEGGLAQWASDSAGQVIGSTASGFIPGWLRQMAQIIDPYYRDTSGDTATDAAINQVKAAIPGLSQTLPKKYSGLGQEQLRDDDWISGIFNTMVNPGDADRIKTTEVTEFLDELYDLTGDLGIYPDAAAPKSFTQDKKTYTISTKEETEIYQKAYGSEVNKLYSEIIKSADFKGLDETDQAAVLEKTKDAARALAKSKISGKYTPPSSIKNKPIYKSDAQAILDAYIEAKKKAEKEAQKEAAKEAYLATKNGQ